MSDHLPECIYAPPNVDPDKGIEWGGLPCICDRLRACEQRVRLEDDDYAYVAAQAEAEGRWRGWDEALGAAREAVLAYADETHKHVRDLFEVCKLDEGDRCNTTAALRAVANRIDALREERK